LGEPRAAARRVSGSPLSPLGRGVGVRGVKLRRGATLTPPPRPLSPAGGGEGRKTRRTRLPSPGARRTVGRAGTATPPPGTMDRMTTPPTPGRLPDRD